MVKTPGRESFTALPRHEQVDLLLRERGASLRDDYVAFASAIKQILSKYRGMFRDGPNFALVDMSGTQRGWAKFSETERREKYRQMRILAWSKMKVPVRERFLRLCEPEPMSGCWIWTGARDRLGYGQFNGPDLRAHRSSYLLFVGPIPEGKELHHICGMRPCVNPAHLRPVTHKENMEQSWPARKLTCRYGHPLTRFGASSQRRCLTCRKRSH